MSDSSRRKNKPRSREERARAKRARVWRRVALIAGGAAALVAVTLAVVLPLRAAGVFLRARTVAEIPGARVDGAMYSYYFY